MSSVSDAPNCFIIQANVITIVNYDCQTFIVQATGRLALKRKNSLTNKPIKIEKKCVFLVDKKVFRFINDKFIGSVSQFSIEGLEMTF